MKLTGSNQSVEKTLHIIEALAESSVPMRLSEISKAVGMPSSTVLRMVNTLVEMGYAYQEENALKRYTLTMRFMRIGQMAAEHISFREIAHPFMVQISSETGESSCLAIEENHKIRYLDVTEGASNLITVRQRIGGSGMMHCTGSGKLFLMQYTDEELDEYIRIKGLPQLTPHTMVTKSDLCFELNETKRRGYAVDDEECEIGVRCIAAPIYDIHGRVAACMSISGPSSRMSRARYERELVPMLCGVTQKITDMMVGKRIVGEDIDLPAEK